MENRLNFNREVDDLAKINEFFQNPQISSEEESTEDSEQQQIQKPNPKVLK